MQEWVKHSKGAIRADKAHEKLLAMGYEGSERTTRRAVHEAKVAFNLGQIRVHKPWVTEPGMWLLCRTPHNNHYATRGIMRSHTGPEGVVADHHRCRTSNRSA